MQSRARAVALIAFLAAHLRWLITDFFPPCLLIGGCARRKSRGHVEVAYACMAPSADLPW